MPPRATRLGSVQNRSLVPPLTRAASMYGWAASAPGAPIVMSLPCARSISASGRSGAPAASWRCRASAGGAPAPRRRTTRTWCPGRHCRAGRRDPRRGRCRGSDEPSPASSTAAPDGAEPRCVDAGLTGRVVAQGVAALHRPGSVGLAERRRAAEPPVPCRPWPPPAPGRPAEPSRPTWLWRLRETGVAPRVERGHPCPVDVARLDAAGHPGAVGGCGIEHVAPPVAAFPGIRGLLVTFQQLAPAAEHRVGQRVLQRPRLAARMRRNEPPPDCPARARRVRRRAGTGTARAPQRSVRVPPAAPTTGSAAVPVRGARRPPARRRRSSPPAAAR